MTENRQPCCSYAIACVEDLSGPRRIAIVIVDIGTLAMAKFCGDGIGASHRLGRILYFARALLLPRQAEGIGNVAPDTAVA